MPEHPGGPKVILKYAGKDATEEYEPIHPPDTLDKFLDKSKHLGEVDMKTVEKEEKADDPDEIERLERVKRMPILEQCYNLMDFEAVARRVMKKTAWAYYSSGADDEIASAERDETALTGADSDCRHFGRTTQPFTKSGFGLESYTTWKISISQPPCSAPRSRSLST